jgi:hypothetical protein
MFIGRINFDGLQTIVHFRADSSLAAASSMSAFDDIAVARFVGLGGEKQSFSPIDLRWQSRPAGIRISDLAAKM